MRHWLARTATRSAHLLLIEAEMGWLTRVSVEQEMTSRGWRQARSPADADILVVCGSDPAGELADAVERTWDQLPGPRARCHVHDADVAVIAGALDGAIAQLIDHAAQQEDADTRTDLDPSMTGHGRSDHGDMDHGDMDHGDMDHGDMDHGGMDHGGMDHGDMDHGDMDHGGMDHGDMDHGDMDMSGPGGIPLASGGEDRDGLAMDVLHLRLGPVLTLWPAGLTVALSLQGDAVVDAFVEHASFARSFADVSGGIDPARAAAAQRCEAAGWLLRLAGADGLAWRALGLRDRLVCEPEATVEDVARDVAVLHREVSRSRLLRWSLRGLAPVTDPDLAFLHGDVVDRLLRLLDPTYPIDDSASTTSEVRADAETIFPPLLVGAELATVRLAVASVSGFLHTEPDVDRQAAHG